MSYSDCRLTGLSAARRHPPISGLDRRDLLAAGADDRLDELPVRVLVAAIEQLAERVRPVRPLVVDAAEIERAERIVRPGG